ncbi:MAG TPA: SDR family oxidoreductase [Anaerolineae bacterium]|nr:SDR family oxidoreductase [Anaerolineae bacterium]HXV99559.1 SDR family oxidoreductase [Anaerolineae bacterium]
MAKPGTVVVIGGTSEIGKRLAQHYANQGCPVVVTSRDAGRAKTTAQEVGTDCVGLSLDLSKPHEIAAALAEVNDVDRLALVAVDRDENTVRNYNIDGALNLVTLKLVGYTEVIHMLAPRMRQHGSIVLYGGLAKDRPYPGSTTVSTVNGGVMTMVHTLAVELAPLRVNAIHPAVVGDSPYWVNKPQEVLDRLRARTPLGELITIDDVVDATVFLLENRAVTGVNLRVDGGWMLT